MDGDYVGKVRTCGLVDLNVQSCWCVGLGMNECSFDRVTYKTQA